MRDFDIVIAGAGPAGLSLAAALATAPVRIALVDRASRAGLAAPSFDGREIALTHASIRRLRKLGAWDRMSPAEVAPLVSARVLNGSSSFALTFANSKRGEALGSLAPNAAIRRALYETVTEQRNCTLIDERAVTSITTDPDAAEVTLFDGEALSARVAIAADTRFSALRQAQGISADMHDFGRTMLVCRVSHERPHGGVATEWFDHGQTVAMLPLNGAMSSFVLTLPSMEIAPLLALSPAAFAAEAERRTRARWGAMQLESTRHAYPLVAVYANRFARQRFALVGDAAVGMHPVTAHGYNFGLAGAFTLARELTASARTSADAGREAGLRRYERTHRLATRPLFEATNAIARLYSDERALPRLARAAGLRLMTAAAPVRRAIEASLSQAR